MATLQTITGHPAGVANIFNLATSTAPHIIPAQYSNGQWPQLQGTLAAHICI